MWVFIRKFQYVIAFTTMAPGQRTMVEEFADGIAVAAYDLAADPAGGGMTAHCADIFCDLATKIGMHRGAIEY
jgi:hypothetical protein